MTAKDKRRAAQSGAKAPAASVPYGHEYSTSVDLAADPVIPYMTRDELARNINRMREQMFQAAKDMEFIEAARLRDEVIKLEDRLSKMTDETAPAAN